MVTKRFRFRLRGGQFAQGVFFTIEWSSPTVVRFAKTSNEE